MVDVAVAPDGVSIPKAEIFRSSHSRKKNEINVALRLTSDFLLFHSCMTGSSVCNGEPCSKGSFSKSGKGMSEYLFYYIYTYIYIYIYIYIYYDHSMLLTRHVHIGLHFLIG
jgi:hypothetical protein